MRNLLKIFLVATLLISVSAPVYAGGGGKIIDCGVLDGNQNGCGNGSSDPVIGSASVEADEPRGEKKPERKENGFLSVIWNVIQWLFGI